MAICLGHDADVNMLSLCHCHSLSLASVNPDWFYLTGTSSHSPGGHKTVVVVVVVIAVVVVVVSILNVSTIFSIFYDENGRFQCCVLQLHRSNLGHVSYTVVLITSVLFMV